MITMKLEVAQRPIEVTIKKEWEYYYKEAEKVINDSFLKFARNWNYKDHQDLLSKVLISYVVKLIETEERLQEYEAETIPMMQNLKELTDKLPID